MYLGEMTLKPWSLIVGDYASRLFIGKGESRMTKLERLEQELKDGNEYAKIEMKAYLKLTPYERKLEDYEDFFEEAFPLAEVMDLSKEEIIELIDKALEEEKPYESEEGLIY